MTDYQKMYTLLFNAITDALMQMEKQNYGSAKETLISAQQRAEELYLSAEDESGRPRCLASEKATTLAVVFFYGNFAMLLFEAAMRRLIICSSSRFLVRPSYSAIYPSFSSNTGSVRKV